MNETRHGTTEELLALRDGDGSAWARAHVETCAVCAGELYRLDQVRSRLKALPAMQPPRDRWPGIALAARRERRARRLHSLVGVAAAAVLAGATFLAVRPAPAAAAAATRVALDKAMLQSRAMEAALEALEPEQRALPGAAATVAAQLTDQLSDVDSALADPGAWRTEPERVVGLWRERTGILSALVDVHAGRATYASF